MIKRFKIPSPENFKQSVAAVVTIMLFIMVPLFWWHIGEPEPLTAGLLTSMITYWITVAPTKPDIQE